MAPELACGNLGRRDVFRPLHHVLGDIVQGRAMRIFMIPTEVLHDPLEIHQQVECLLVYRQMLVLRLVVTR